MGKVLDRVEEVATPPNSPASFLRVVPATLVIGASILTNWVPVRVVVAICLPSACLLDNLPIHLAVEERSRHVNSLPVEVAETATHAHSRTRYQVVVELPPDLEAVRHRLEVEASGNQIPAHSLGELIVEAALAILASRLLHHHLAHPVARQILSEGHGDEIA